MYIQEPEDRLFDWDEAKRWSTLEKHGIDFVRATKIFAHPHVLLPANSQIEDRWFAIGQIEERIIAVVFTMRGDVTRIITARHARRNERLIYEAQNTRGDPQNGGPH